MSVKASLSGEVFKDKSFPKLMISEDGQIVLFECIGQGVALNSVCAEIGMSYDDWDVAIFKDYNGQITLKNE